MFNILTEPVIRFESDGGTGTEATLPEIYAELLADSVSAFPSLRPHQRHAWHAFLVQLGAMAMHRAGTDTPPDTAAEWLSLLRGLTPDYPDDEPWHLVVEDITKPAFMQPPARSSEREKDYQNEVATPDELDMLVTSKNHDLKSSVAAHAGVDDWLFALITLQTMEGFGGAGNYGVSRMNGGLGNRPAFTLAPRGGPGAHLRRDVLSLLERQDSLVDQYPMQPGGIGLLWTVPWDGEKSEALLPSQLDPFFIEVCRRIRLRCAAAGNVSAVRTSSKGARVESKELNGRTGDPWTPVSVKDNKSLTLASRRVHLQPRGGLPDFRRLAAAHFAGSHSTGAGNPAGRPCHGPGAGQDRRLLRAHNSIAATHDPRLWPGRRRSGVGGLGPGPD